MEFVEQNKAMDEISSIVGKLNDMGQAMGEEITKQNAMIDELDTKATPLKDRIKDMNTKTRFGQCKPSQDSAPLSLSPSLTLPPIPSPLSLRLSKITVRKESTGDVMTDVGSTLIKTIK